MATPADSSPAPHVLVVPSTQGHMLALLGWCSRRARDVRHRRAAVAVPPDASPRGRARRRQPHRIPGPPGRAGVPAFPWRQMSALYRTFRDGDDVSEGLRRNYLWNLDSPGGFVLNTFRRLEERYLEAPPLADMGFRRARAVGPLAPMADRTRGGVVCGWNSVLEATAAGVAMLAWPMTVDQFMNARLLVDELLAAVPVSWGGLNAEPGADEVARVLDDAVNGRRWAEVASRVQELADEAAAAVRPGGDSWRELEDGFALVSARQFHS